MVLTCLLPSEQKRKQSLMEWFGLPYGANGYPVRKEEKQRLVEWMGYSKSTYWLPLLVRRQHKCTKLLEALGLMSSFWITDRATRSELPTPRAS